MSDPMKLAEEWSKLDLTKAQNTIVALNDDKKNLAEQLRAAQLKVDAVEQQLQAERAKNGGWVLKVERAEAKIEALGEMIEMMTEKILRQ